VRRVLIYRNELLPASETFILAQAHTLQRYAPAFAGLKRVDSSLNLQMHTRPAVSDSRLRRRIFLCSGMDPCLERRIAALQPELIHAHFAIDASAILPVARRMRLPLIATLHGYDVACEDEAFRRWPATRVYLRRRKDLWRYASLFLCVAEHVRTQAILRGFPPEKLFVHHIGVRLGAPPLAPAESRERTTILFAGRLVEKKGCIHLLRAMPRILQRVPEAKLIILGDGPRREALEREARHFCRSVTFLGQQSHPQVKMWMRRARVLAAPSVRASNGDQEGLPTVLCEAQAAGLPVITFATNAVTEALPAELRGRMPDERDKEGLADAIVRLLQEDEEWKHASALGRKHAEEHFDITRQTRLLEEKYDECLRAWHRHSGGMVFTAAWPFRAARARAQAQ